MDPIFCELAADAASRNLHFGETTSEPSINRQQGEFASPIRSPLSDRLNIARALWSQRAFRAVLLQTYLLLQETSGYHMARSQDCSRFEMTRTKATKPGARRGSTEATGNNFHKFLELLLTQSSQDAPRYPKAYFPPSRHWRTSMDSNKTTSPQDMAKLVSGGYDGDPAGEITALRKILHSQRIGQLLEFLEDDPDREEIETSTQTEDVQQLVASTVNRLSNSRVLHVRWSGPLSELLDGGTIQGRYSDFAGAERDFTIESIDSDTCVARLVLSESPGELVNLIAVDLGLDAPRPKPTAHESLRPSWGHGELEEWNSSRQKRPRAGEVVADSVLKTNRSAPNGEINCHEVGDVMLRGTVERQDHRRFAWENSGNGHSVDVTCKVGKQPFELAVIEYTFPTDTDGRKVVYCREPVVLLQRKDNASELVRSDVELVLPVEACDPDDVTLRVRPIKDSELRMLSPRQISECLAVAEPLSLPIREDESTGHIYIRLNQERIDRLQADNVTWIFSVIPKKPIESMRGVYYETI